VASRNLAFTPLNYTAHRAPLACAVHRTLCPTPPRSARRRTTPACPRAGFAGARGHPRAQAEGRARGPHDAAPTRGHQRFLVREVLEVIKRFAPRDLGQPLV